MKLSDHLTRAEFEYSPTAIGRGIDNSMTDAHLKNAIVLAKEIFDPIRKFRGKAIKINSGYRSSALNRAVGGSKTSQHCTGEAVDLPLTAEEFHWIRLNLVYDQLIWEFGTDTQPSWVHVSFSASGKNRMQVLKAKKVGKKTVYSSF
jgi:hypothetical protein